MAGRENPCTKYLKTLLTIRLDRDTVANFKAMAAETGIAYRTLIDLYLRDRAVRNRKLDITRSPRNPERSGAT